MNWHDGVNTGIRRPLIFGTAAVALGFGGFGTWAATAPLESAVVAPGKVVVEGNNKVVQHLEGGIVERISLVEGQRIAAGEVLLTLDTTATRTSLNRLRAQMATLKAIEARAKAERHGSRMLDMSGLEDVPEPVRADQSAEFEARLAKHDAELAVLDRQIAAARDTIAGREAQLGEIRHQLALLAEQRESLQQLLDRKLVRKSQVLEIQRQESVQTAQMSELQAANASARQTIAQIEEQIETSRRERVEKASAELSEARFKIADASEQIRQAADAVQRSQVLAPISGRVINLRKLNPGAVVAAGEPIMEIVPEDATLAIEAHVAPKDVDGIYAGQPARLRFPSFDGNQFQGLTAEVSQVSADRLEDPRTGASYYKVQLTLTPETPTPITRSIAPGHPVEVAMTTGERTFLSYLMEPISRILSRAARES